MLVECGLVRAMAGDGAEACFRPSLGRIAALGSPQRIVELFVALHGPKAESAADDVLSGLCDPDDLPALPALLGEPEATPEGVRMRGGAIPPEERVILARHLMQHGVVGTARPEKSGSGGYSDRFEAAEFIAAARVHLGLSAADAEALSMTELQRMLELKFPDRSAAAGRNVPTREEYDAHMAAFEALRKKGAGGG